MPEAYIGIGSNLGDREATIETARRAVNQRAGFIQSSSSLYDTVPWGPVPQGNYLNQVVRISTRLSPRELLDVLQDIERAAGRDRENEVRYGPRTLDLDILLFGDHTVREDGLTIPHPEMAKRAFVLVPLAEMAPDLVIAGSPVRTLLGGVDTSGVRRYSPK